ncbi:MAG: rhomboid family intramembrane serine protease [Promethearchaeota archaeon]
MYVLDAEAIKRARISLTLIFINIICFITFNIILEIDYLLLFVQINSRIIDDLELWRLFTAIFLHADIFHLFSNMIALFFFGTAVENNYRRHEYLIIYFLSGLLGNIFSLILLPHHSISLGASGAIFGLIGAAFILYATGNDRTLLYLGLFYLVYFIISSFSPGINPWAHIFGLLGGILFGYLFFRLNRKKKIENNGYY